MPRENFGDGLPVPGAEGDSHLRGDPAPGADLRAAGGGKGAPDRRRAPAAQGAAAPGGRAGGGAGPAGGRPHHQRLPAGGTGAALRQAGLDRLTVSLDSLDPGRFQELPMPPCPWTRCWRGWRPPGPPGFQGIKLNCVLRAGRQRGGHPAPGAASPGSTGYHLRFIEFMDVGTRNGWRMDAVVPGRGRWPQHHPRPLAPGAGPARRPRTAWPSTGGTWTAAGELGLIASVTEPFCAGCDRARLSADGSLYTCLFATEAWT